MALWDFLKIKPALPVVQRRHHGAVQAMGRPPLPPNPIATEQDKMDMIAAILKDPRAKEMIKMPGCNRYTNSPCEWSRTDPIEDKCRMCGTQFPGWY